MLHFISKDKLINSVFLLPLVWMATGMLWDGDGDMRLVPIVLVSMFVSIIFFKFNCIAFNFSRNPWTKLLLLSSLFGTTAYMTYGFDSRELRATLVVLFLLLTLPKSLFSKRYLQWFLLLSSISCALYGYEYQFITKLARGNWPINAIPYATICGLLLITSVGFIIDDYSGKSKLSLSTSAVFSMLGVILSQSRGPLLSIFLVLFSFYCLLFFFRNKLVLFLSSFLILLFGTVLSQTSLVGERIERTYSEYQAIQKGELNTSIGIRLQMYSIALDLWKEKPILGYGEKVKDKFNEMESEGLITSKVNRLISMTFHNGYLDKFVLYGVLGGAIFLLFIMFPIYHSFQFSLHEGSFLLWGPAVFLALCNLTDAPFINAQAAVYYMFFIGYIYMMLSEEKRALNS